MKRIFKNWKTTLSGIGTMITGVALVVNGQSMEGFAAIAAGFGLIFSRDSKEADPQ